MSAATWVPVVAELLGDPERLGDKGTTADAGVGAGGIGVSVFGACLLAEWVPVVRGGFAVTGIARAAAVEQRAGRTGGTS